MEYAEKGVRINAVAPGRVVTDMMLGSKIMDMSPVAPGLPLSGGASPRRWPGRALARLRRRGVRGRPRAVVDGGFGAT